MVILNASIGISLKILSVFSSMFDLVNLINFFNSTRNKLNFIFNYSVLNICSYDRTCRSIEQFARFLYLLSFLTYFYFYLKFDKKFKSSFDLIFRKNSQTNGQIAKPISTTKTTKLSF